MLRHLWGTAQSRREVIDVLARSVAEASVDPVKRLVQRRVAGMAPFEARGYIRGRAGTEIRRRARAAVAARPEVFDAWEIIAARASERIAPLVLRQLAAEARDPGTRQQAA